MKKLIIVGALILLSVSTNLFAQSVGGSFMLAIPKNEFNDNVSNLGGGIQAQITLATPDKHNPFTVGLNASYMIYGMEHRHVPLSMSVPDVTVEVSRTNSMASLHFLFQVSPFDGQVRPYFEGLAGGSYIFTETSVSGDNDFGDFASSTNFDDFAWSLGVGGGFLINLTGDNPDIPGGLFLDFKARYMFGGEAEYLAEGDVIVNNGRTFVQTRTSTTDYLAFQIGVVAAF
jgi:hypothetical protein